MARVQRGNARLTRRGTGLSLIAVLSALAVVLALPLSAQAFNPAYQSSPGSCSQNTQSVAHAVGDIHANGVLRVYARATGVHASDSTLVAKMDKALLIGTVIRSTTTANHGCDGHGGVYPVGGRTLYTGETVAVKVPARFAGRGCAAGTTGCQGVVIVARVVLPTNCWNLNTGTIPVLVHVRPVHHKPKPKPKPKVGKPAASAAFSCSAGGVVVTVSNGASATAPATFEVNGVAYGPVAAGASQDVTVPVATGTTNYVTVVSGGRVLINDQAYANTCTTAPTTVPSATAALSCSAGGVVVTLSNGVAATEPASFAVNGTAYGPVAPGASQTATVPVASGATANVTVTSGSQTLIDNQPYTNNCAPATAPAPSASSSLSC